MYLNSCWLSIIVNSCFCRNKVSGDYEALYQRLQTLPDQLSYDIMVSANLVSDAHEKKKHTVTQLVHFVRFFLDLT